MERGAIAMCIQVCWELDRENLHRETSGLMEAMKAFQLKEGTIVTLSQNDHIVEDGMKITIVPFHEFVSRYQNIIGS